MWLFSQPWFIHTAALLTSYHIASMVEDSYLHLPVLESRENFLLTLLKIFIFLRWLTVIITPFKTAWTPSLKWHPNVQYLIQYRWGTLKSSRIATLNSPLPNRKETGFLKCFINLYCYISNNICWTAAIQSEMNFVKPRLVPVKISSPVQDENARTCFLPFLGRQSLIHDDHPI